MASGKVPSKGAASAKPRFQIGDRVRVPLAFPPGHIRTPLFLRGKTGVVVSIFGTFPNPERLAYGMQGLPAIPLYMVKFTMDEVWQGDGAYGPKDTVTADIYDHWLEPVL
jgi:nitrile hydratase subunit beta